MQDVERREDDPLRFGLALEAAHRAHGHAPEIGRVRCAAFAIANEASGAYAGGNGTPCGSGASLRPLAKNATVW